MSLRDVLQALYDERGKLTPALVVDVARDPDHVLHNRFEWDDSIAGERYRRDQAHELIRSVRVNYVSARTEEPLSIRAFQAVKDPDDTDGRKYVYVPTEAVVQDPIVMRLILADMERDWRNLRRRWEEFDEFWNMVGEDVRVGLGL